ncbi:GNAT family N-acetyltransferase [Gorillibacterium timonense]|uniref:GNAT family N-acetyltransferase n=1 Tax=Gorillibacterium timonense TaxID=1689269 RepID=UPI00071E268B|nr:GNAT family N-acetyltransferase [Gorillibacterium timonense]
MIIAEQDYLVKGVSYSIRSAARGDAAELSDLRVMIDGETEYLDREAGEAFLDQTAFEQIIRTDTESPRNLFLVAVAHDRIVGFSRCEGSSLKRLSHKVEFGICIIREAWGYGIGKNLMKESITWADSSGIKKIALHVLATNHKAIELYKHFGFEVEGRLRNDKFLSDGNYYDTIVMGRIQGGVHDEHS